MDFKLDLADSGAVLERLGFGGTLRGGKGRMSGQLSWAGSPLSLHVPSLDGRINLALDAGQFLKAGPGAARLLSVLNLQALPRRLLLDFRDVFQEGFRLRQRHRRRDHRRRRGQHQQPAHARRAGRGADGRQRRHRAARPRTCACWWCPKSTPARPRWPMR